MTTAPRLGVRVPARGRRLDADRQADRDRRRRAATASAPRSRSTATRSSPGAPFADIGTQRRPGRGLHVRAHRRRDARRDRQADRVGRRGRRQARLLGRDRRRHDRRRRGCRHRSARTSQGAVYTFAPTGTSPRTETGKLDRQRRRHARRPRRVASADSTAGDTLTASDRRTETAKLIASDGGALDGLGSSVAIDGDTIVAGAPGHAFGVSREQGSVYTFARTGAAARTETAQADRQRRPPVRPVRLLGRDRRQHDSSPGHRRRRRHERRSGRRLHVRAHGRVRANRDRQADRGGRDPRRRVRQLCRDRPEHDRRRRPARHRRHERRPGLRLGVLHGRGTAAPATSTSSAASASAASAAAARDHAGSVRAQDQPEQFRSGSSLPRLARAHTRDHRSRSHSPRSRP